MLRYRLVRAVNRVYPFVVLWLYIGLFFCAFALIFIFPPGTIVLFGLGLAGLFACSLAAKALGVVQRLVARGILGAGACPSCGRSMQTARDVADEWECASCGTVFVPNGAEDLPAGA